MRQRKGIVCFAAAALLSVIAGLHASAKEEEIAQRGIRFARDAVMIKVGDTLHFRNQDDVMHNLMVRDSWNNLQNEGLQKSGAVVTKTFTEAGLFEIRCAIHPRMKMSVSVEK